MEGLKEIVSPLFQNAYVLYSNLTIRINMNILRWQVREYNSACHRLTNLLSIQKKNPNRLTSIGNKNMILDLVDPYGELIGLLTHWLILHFNPKTIAYKYTITCVGKIQLGFVNSLVFLRG